jgi:uncharacterized membrane protein YhfC
MQIQFSRIFIFLVGLAGLCFSTPLLDFQHTETGEQDTAWYNFEFSLSEDGSRLIMNLESTLDAGSLDVLITGAGYDVIGHYSNAGVFSHQNVIFGPLSDSEPVLIRIAALYAIGDWHISFTEFSPRHSVTAVLVSGILVILIVIASVVLWKARSHSAMKWVLIGGLVWIIGVALKFLCAYTLNNPILSWFESTLGHTGYLLVGSMYIGSLTGIFEIGITLLFALGIKSMYESPGRALGVGLGAGGLEAALIGLSQIGSYAMVMGGLPGNDQVLVALAKASSMTPLFVLVAPVERMIAMLCHISSRMLVLFAVATKRHRFFWYAFFIMTALDAVAGYFHLAELLNRISMWWIELLIVPFGLISILVIQWCITHWPENEKKMSAT